MKTKLHEYCFDMRKPAEAKAYQELAARLRAEIKAGKRGREMHCIAPECKINEASTSEVEIEPKHLFQNQWNTTTSRVFDWFEVYPVNASEKSIKRGHWLEITPEMDAIRHNTLKCGYTGQQYPASKGWTFNLSPAGLGSEYLKESELWRLRLVPIWDTDKEGARPELTESERALLLPLYRELQKEGAKTRAGAKKAEERRETLAKFDGVVNPPKKIVEDATRERDGMLWLLDRGFSTDCAIYYKHTGKFGFNWRKNMQPEDLSKLLDVLSEFPFEYEIKGRPVHT